MNVATDQKAGFCFGVVQAIKKAEEYLAEHGRLYCLGQIVHNEAEAGRLKEKGLVSIDYDEYARLENVVVLIRAHGEPPSTYETAKKNNLTLIDATCPLVTRLQKKIKNASETLKQNEKIVIFGNPAHPEVIGLAGQQPDKTLVVQHEDDLKNLGAVETVHLYSQTTKDKAKYASIKQALERLGNTAVVFNDSICRQVYNRKDELAKFAAAHDVMIFVGGSKSSNAKVLFDICKQANANSYFISGKDQLDKAWFAPNDTIGISGATSTPPWQMEEVAEAVKKITG
ncbi:MAG: 4-hydroxy-3-methylbut-2-enyl diphosphate reductase [Bacteroidota bacterium]